MGTNTFIRDLDIGEFNGLHGRRVEEIADGLPLWHGAQLAIDTTLVSPLHGDGTARRGAANSSGVALQAAWRVKEATCPELSGAAGRARLVVLAAEAGGRWSQEASATHLARTGAGRLLLSVEFPLGVQSGESLCSFSAGETARAWRRGGGSSNGRCSERRQVSVMRPSHVL